MNLGLGHLIYDCVDTMNNKMRPCIVFPSMNGILGFFIPISSQDWNTNDVIPIGKISGSSSKWSYAVLNKCFIRRIKGDFSSRKIPVSTVRLILKNLMELNHPLWEDFIDNGLVGM